MSKKISDNSVIWLLGIPLILLPVYYFLDSEGRDELLQLTAMFWGWASFHLFFRIIFDPFRPKVVRKEQIKNGMGFVISKTYIYIAVIVSIILFFSFMNYLSKALLLTIVFFDLVVGIAMLIKQKINFFYDNHENHSP